MSQQFQLEFDGVSLKFRTAITGYYSALAKLAILDEKPIPETLFRFKYTRVSYPPWELQEMDTKTRAIHFETTADTALGLLKNFMKIHSVRKLIKLPEFSFEPAPAPEAQQ